MTEDDFRALVTGKAARTVLDRLTEIPAADRRKYAAAAADLYEEYTFRWTATSNRRPEIFADSDALNVAVLATASLTELKKLRFRPHVRALTLVEICERLQPAWLEAWVNWAIEDSPYWVRSMSELWEAGLIARPDSDARILGYYAHHQPDWDPRADPFFLDHDVWRFFEVEGGGEFSLAGHDKYAKRDDTTWSNCLTTLAATGRLDRGRLLDASLDALDRDFGQFRAGWYSRFHLALNPTDAEKEARADRYLSLLSSTIPPTVSFALKIVQGLAKSGAIAPKAVLPALEMPLQARQKSTVTAALRLVANAAKAKAHPPATARLALLALVSEAADIQDKALDVFEASGGAGDLSLRQELSGYLPHVAPSVRARVAELAGAVEDRVEVGSPRETETQTAQLVQPIDSADAALAAFLGVLEQHRDPFAVEHAMDGLARFGAEFAVGSDQLSPLRKRARQLIARPDECQLRTILSLTGLVLTEDVPVDAVLNVVEISDHQITVVCLRRNAEIIRQIKAGHRLPMMSAPSDTSGGVLPSDLVARYQSYVAAGVSPGETDLSLALLRLSGAGRQAARDGVTSDSESARAIRYALGDAVDPGPTASLWAAAWAARQPAESDPAIARLFSPPLPDCGQPAEIALSASRLEKGGYQWFIVDCPVGPHEPKPPITPIPAMFFPARRNRHFDNSACGYVYADVAWSGLVRPGWTEPFFRQAILSMDTWQKLSDHFCAAYLEPCFRPGPALGPLGAATLAYYMATEDKAVAGLAAEAVATLATQGRIDATGFATALAPFLGSNALPVPRWTRRLSAIAERSPAHAAFVQDSITLVLPRLDGPPPRDLGGLLELHYELHVAARTAPEDADTVAYLRAITAGGKLGTFSKKLLALAS